MPIGRAVVWTPDGSIAGVVEAFYPDGPEDERPPKVGYGWLVQRYSVGGLDDAFSGAYDTARGVSAQSPLVQFNTLPNGDETLEIWVSRQSNESPIMAALFCIGWEGQRIPMDAIEGDSVADFQTTLNGLASACRE